MQDSFMIQQIEIDNWLKLHESHQDPPLILAAREGRIDVLNYLLQLDPNLNVLDRYGNNALWAACYNESSACIARLIDAGIDIDYLNPNGSSALMYAASSGKTAVVAQLLQAGANPHLTNPDDFKALDLAANRQCLQLLRQATSQI
jgi:uncharacterized protein